MFLMRADPLREQVGEGLALAIKNFLGPVKWHPDDRCPASPEKEDQRAAGSPAALTQLALCLRFAPDLKGRELATSLCNPQ